MFAGCGEKEAAGNVENGDDNTFVVGIRGNFDQAQSGVKAIFGDKELEKEMDAAGFQFFS